MRRWRTSSKTGNKKERKLVLANDNPQQGERQGGLPHFFVVGRLSASFASGRWWSRKSSLETKVSLRGSVSHTKRRWGCEFFVFLKYPPMFRKRGSLFRWQKWGCFHLFSLLLEAIKTVCETKCFIEHPPHTQSSPQADIPRGRRLC